jgi:hypothetical protein
MSMHKDSSGMPTSELQEFMNLKGWNRTKLAAALDITTNTVDRWFMAGKVAGGPASILLREWLNRERSMAMSNGHKQPA